MEPARPAQAALTMKARIRSLATLRPARAAAASSSRTACHERPILLRARLASRTRTISAAPALTQASHRVSGKSAPSEAGALTATVSPWSPPNRPGNWVANEGRATASRSVAPAR